MSTDRLRAAAEQLTQARAEQGTESLTIEYVDESGTLCRTRFEESDSGTEYERIEEYHDGTGWRHRGSELVAVHAIDRRFE